MKKGIKVKIINCYEAKKYADKVWTTRSDSWKLGDGTEVILLEGKSGGFACSCLREIKES